MNADENPFKKAVRVNEYVLVAIAGTTGGGKTKSALRFATGLLDGTGKRIAFGDTENGRGLHYAPPIGDEPDFKETFDFDHFEITAPFTPEQYLKTILQAEAAGYGALIVDSMSHEYAGEGGIDDMAQEALARMCTDENGVFDAKKAERLTALSWKDPKRRHKKMMVRLLQRQMHIIFCLRAEPKIKFDKVKEEGRNGKTYEKTVIVDMGIQPICEKQFMFEMTLSMLLTTEKPGIPSFLKIEGQHKPAFEGNRCVDEDAGRAIARWASGGRIAGPGKMVKADAKSDKKNADPMTQDPQLSENKQEAAPQQPDKKADTERLAGADRLIGDGNYIIITSSKGDGHRTDDVEIWRNGMLSQIERLKSQTSLDAFLKVNTPHMDFVMNEGHGLAYAAVQKAVTKRLKELSRP
jgi:hypothetical protein